MDKYEFNIKVEQIKKLVNKGDYETAMKIADTVDWRRVRSTSLLTMIAQVYEKNEEYQDAKDILLLAFERAPIGKGLLFKLTDLALREGNVPEAEAYYREFCELSSDDPRQNLLRYLILEAKQAPLEQLINSLERYCQDELDEKWLYKLAELYQEAGRESDCVKICDRIMLMFGLGKYVDKAMELKLQYAPLTKYQMDLVENREKYEEKLRAVEEKFDKTTYRPAEADYDELDDGSEELEADDDLIEDEIVAKLHEAEAEENLAKEMSHITPYDEEENGVAGETRVIGNIRDLKERQGAEKQAARELSVNEAPLAVRESAAAHVEIDAFGDDETVLEDWDLEQDEEENNHLMIEAEDSAAGLSLALESLKKIHREQGNKNSVAKISGEKLNRKGILAVSDRLAGKDLIVERAADLDRITIDELCELMEKDDTGIIVVLIDTPNRMERLHNAYPVLADKFQYIGCQTLPERLPKIGTDRTGNAEMDDSDSDEELSADEKTRDSGMLKARLEKEAEAARKRLVEREEEIRRQAAQDAEAARMRQAAYLAGEDKLRQAGQEEMTAGIPEEYRGAGTQTGYKDDYRRGYAAGMQGEYQAGYENSGEADYRAGYEDSGEADYQAGYENGGEAGYRGVSENSRGYGYQDDFGREAEDAVRVQAERTADEARRQAEGEEEFITGSQEPAADHGQGMDVEEFVQYACRYASEIDCSISGKSMLALYERAEMMEEDGILLSKGSAEDLIEEAADKAEKRSFGGLFSSKYDKDGLLVLKEKHFFD